MSEPRSGWTFETMYAHMCQKITAQEKLIDERFAGSDRFHEERYRSAQDAEQAALDQTRSKASLHLATIGLLIAAGSFLLSTASVVISIIFRHVG